MSHSTARRRTCTWVALRPRCRWKRRSSARNRCCSRSRVACNRFTFLGRARLMLTRATRYGFAAMAVLGLLITASPAAAQDPAPPVVVTGGLDFVNQYNFRGIRQNTEGVSIWPFVDFGFTPY